MASKSNIVLDMDDMTQDNEQDAAIAAEVPAEAQHERVTPTAMYAEHVDPQCPNFGETVRWPIESRNGVFVAPMLRCATCVGGQVELRRVRLG